MGRNVKCIFLCAVIALLAGWTGYWFGFRSRSIIRVPEMVVRHDTIRPTVPEPKVIVRAIPADVDTAAILADYFLEKQYLDTIIERPYLRVELTDVIARNTLLDRTVVVDYSQPVVYNNTLTLGSLQGLHNCAVLVGYRRKSWEFKVGYDLYNRSVVFGLSKDLWRW